MRRARPRPLAMPQVLALLCIAAATCVTPARAVAAPTGPTAVVSLGDSYIAGNAGRWRGNSDDPFGDRSGTDRAAVPNGYDPGKVYGTTDGGCFRSDVAEIKSTGIPVDQAINLACSGAESPNIWRLSHGGQSLEGERPQADALAEVARSHRVQMVVLSIGGNDVGFGDILQACMTGYLTGSGSCRNAQRAQVQARFATAMAAVDRPVKEIRAAMAGAGYAPADYHLVVQSYPSPLPRGAEMRYPESGRGHTRLPDVQRRPRLGPGHPYATHQRRTPVRGPGQRHRLPRPERRTARTRGLLQAHAHGRRRTPALRCRQ
ncbi:hypothetical protein [Streptomyces sp. NPDC017993]|uniref:hypothetical protein n=1 Tax=Streptomyces sp. NPDC017993 TaxID=3365027 RepID=UPI00379812A7